MSYGATVLYPAPSVVTSHTIAPLSSSSSAELLAPIWYARAPFSPFTRTTWLCGACIAGDWYGAWYGIIPYGATKGF